MVQTLLKKVINPSNIANHIPIIISQQLCFFLPILVVLIHIVLFLSSGSRHGYHADERWPQPLPGLCGPAQWKPPEAPGLCPRSGGSSALATSCQSSPTSTDETSRPPARATSHVQPVRGEPAQGAWPEPPEEKKQLNLLRSVHRGFLPHPHPCSQSLKWRHFRWSVFKCYVFFFFFFLYITNGLLDLT